MSEPTMDDLLLIARVYVAEAEARLRRASDMVGSPDPGPRGAEVPIDMETVVGMATRLLATLDYMIPWGEYQQGASNGFQHD